MKLHVLGASGSLAGKIGFSNNKNLWRFDNRGKSEYRPRPVERGKGDTVIAMKFSRLKFWHSINPRT